MAMRMPCITSALANNAVGAPPAEAILIGNTPDEYADHILRLLGDDRERDRLAENGHRFVHEHFDWDRAADALEGMIRQRSEEPAIAP